MSTAITQKSISGASMMVLFSVWGGLFLICMLTGLPVGPI